MNGGICEHILAEAKKHLDSRLPLDACAEDLLIYTRADLDAACGACAKFSGS